MERMTDDPIAHWQGRRVTPVHLSPKPYLGRTS
jgi:hypothetical protein